MTIPTVLKRYADKIESVEKSKDEWYFVHLKPGWFCTLTETHTISDASLQICAGYFDSVVPCQCDECVELLRTHKEQKEQ
jgi:hypothetical protein